MWCYNSTDLIKAFPYLTRKLPITSALASFQPFQAFFKEDIVGKTQSVKNEINDGWNPFGCFSLRVLLLFMLHAVVAYWDTYRTKPLLILLETQFICVRIKPNDMSDGSLSFYPVSVNTRSLQWSTAEYVKDKTVSVPYKSKYSNT